MNSISSNPHSPSGMLSELARQLDGKGQIAADYVTRSLAKNGEPASISVTFGNLDATSKLLSRFGIGAAKARREVAYTHLCDLVRRSDVSNGEQLLANIRKVVEHTGKLKGKDVAAEIRHFLGDDPAKVLKGADVAPQATGTIRLMAVSPLRIIADHTIVRSSTMADAVGNNRDQRDIADTLRDKMQKIVKDRNDAQDPRGAGEVFTAPNPAAPHKQVKVMADIVLSGKGYENKFIESKDLKEMYRELFDGLSGTVAVEPFPDDATRTTLGAPVSYDYGVDHLKALLAAIKESTAAAKDRGAQLRFVVASADPKAVDLLQELDAGSLKKTTGGRFAT